MTFSSRTTVNKKLKEFGIPLKIPDESRRRTGAHVYGYSKIQGRLVKSKKEQKIIKLIGNMRADGISYQKISDFLINSKIKTKTKKDNWKSKVIRDIFLKSEFNLENKSK